MRVRKVLLLCGTISSVLWIGADIIASMMYKGYSYFSQVPSELSAIGAPTRLLLVPIIVIYLGLLLAFGIGVLSMEKGKRALRLTGILLIANVIVSVVMLFFPMNLRGSVGTISDIMHVVFGSVTTLIFLFTVGLGSAVNGKRFRNYSIGTILILIIFAALTAITSTRMAEGFPTPWLGIYERLYVYSFMIWVLVLSVILLRSDREVS